MPKTLLSPSLKVLPQTWLKRKPSLLGNLKISGIFTWTISPGLSPLKKTVLKYSWSLAKMKRCVPRGTSIRASCACTRWPSKTCCLVKASIWLEYYSYDQLLIHNRNNMCMYSVGQWYVILLRPTMQQSFIPTVLTWWCCMHLLKFIGTMFIMCTVSDS